ncbi:MAG: hypothetical protein NTZ10_00720 [Candidatus Saganbacteria bacterium]|nr:hypothetical protein [Candidatus Saganbacteria bacterium]
MKNFVIYFVALVFVAAVASVTLGSTAMEDEAQAVRNYLNVIDAKLAKAKKTTDAAKVNQLHAEKAATLARWNKLKASKVVAPTPATIIVNPTPVVIVTPPAKAGRGLGLYINGGLDAGLIGFAGNLDYDLSGSVVQGLSVRIGANYLSGTNPNGNDSFKVVSAKLGAVYYITPFMPALGVPLTWYVGGAGLYPVKVSGGSTGSWGVEAYLGANYNVPEMGIVNFELGYSGLKYAADQPALKGLDLKIGYGIKF